MYKQPWNLPSCFRCVVTFQIQAFWGENSSEKSGFSLMKRSRYTSALLMHNSFLARNKNSLNLWWNSAIITVFRWGSLAIFIWFGILSCSQKNCLTYKSISGKMVEVSGWVTFTWRSFRSRSTSLVLKFQLLYALSWWRRWRNVNHIWVRTSSPCNFCEARSWEGGSLRICSSTVRGDLFHSYVRPSTLFVDALPSFLALN